MLILGDVGLYTVWERETLGVTDQCKYIKAVFGVSGVCVCVHVFSWVGLAEISICVCV